MSLRTKLIFIIISFILAIIFILQNMIMVEIRFFFWTISMPRSLLMFLLLALGLAIGWFLNSYSLSSRKKKSTRSKN